MQKKKGGGEDRAAWMAMKSLYLLIWQLFCQTWKMTNIKKCLSEGTWCLHSVAFTHCSVLGGDTQGLHQEGHPAWKYAITCGSSSWIKKQPKVFMTFFPLSLQNLKKHNKKNLLMKRTINRYGHRKQTQLSLTKETLSHNLVTLLWCGMAGRHSLVSHSLHDSFSQLDAF